MSKNNADKNKRQCIVCPTKHLYEYCPACGKGDPSKKWMFTFCSENCKDIYSILENYSKSNIDAIKAKDELSKYDLSDKDNYIGTLKKLVDEINEKTVVKKTVEAVEIPKEDSESIIDTNTIRRKNKRKSVSIITDEIVNEI